MTFSMSVCQRIFFGALNRKLSSVPTESRSGSAAFCSAGRPATRATEGCAAGQRAAGLPALRKAALLDMILELTILSGFGHGGPGAGILGGTGFVLLPEEQAASVVEAGEGDGAVFEEAGAKYAGGALTLGEFFAEFAFFGEDDVASLAAIGGATFEQDGQG